MESARFNFGVGRLVGHCVHNCSGCAAKTCASETPREGTVKIKAQIPSRCSYSSTIKKMFAVLIKMPMLAGRLAAAFRQPESDSESSLSDAA